MHSVAILAAGKGTRMKSTTPKVLHKICNKPMLFCIIDEAKKLSDDIHVILGYQSERIIAQLNLLYDGDIKIHIQDLTRYPGTAGAFIPGKPDFKHSHVLILNGDMPLVDAESLKGFLRDEFCVGIFNSSAPHGYGRAILEKNDKNEEARVIKIVEEKDCTDEQRKISTLNAGIYSLKVSLLESSLQKIDNSNAQGEFYLTDLIEIANETKRVIMLDEHICMGVNSKVNLAQAQEIMLDRLRSLAQENGVIMHNPKSIFIDFDSKFFGECEIYENVRIENSILTDSIIKSNSVVENSTITSSEIGPLAHIRPDSKIIDSKIGNFVEIKNSTITKSKVNHLSYIGDTQIDSGTNIGAGVITCNYNGKVKSKTNIGKNVFIGSDVQLIAPLDIEDNVLIAAGSTITKDCKSGELVISRSLQKNIKDGYYRFFKDSKKS